MTPQYDKLHKDLYESIRQGLIQGELKMGDRIPLMRFVNVLSEGNNFAPQFEELIITPNYPKDLREYFERVSKE